MSLALLVASSGVIGMLPGCKRSDEAPAAGGATPAIGSGARMELEPALALPPTTPEAPAAVPPVRPTVATLSAAYVDAYAAKLRGMMDAISARIAAAGDDCAAVAVTVRQYVRESAATHDEIGQTDARLTEAQRSTVDAALLQRSVEWSTVIEHAMTTCADDRAAMDAFATLAGMSQPHAR